MEFNEILGLFDIQRVFVVGNQILGQRGQLFQLSSAVAYLYEHTRGDGRAWLIINDREYELDKIQLAKIRSLLRLTDIKPVRLQRRDFWMYSQEVEVAIHDLIEKYPHLQKGSAHLAFAPRNYTRFSENLVFDFDYIYDDEQLCEAIASFDLQYDQWKREQPDLYLPDLITDDILYRYLLNLTQELQYSINGRISLPDLIRHIFNYAFTLQGKDLVLDMGPNVLQLRKSTVDMDMFDKKRNVDLDNATVFRLNYSSLTAMLRSHREGDH
ncbi:MAG: hypothetical protein ACXAE3_10930 [Candidatus Kariarchaeaceae archaeon]|jgi:hypothetical protein